MGNKIEKSNTIAHPSGWGKDSLTQFFDMAQHNNYATFHNIKKGFEHLIEINDIFASTIDYSKNSEEYRSLLFLLKAHSAFIAAVRLATSYQVAEAYMVLRGALENALYGWHIHKDKDLFKLWLKRHESETCEEQVKEKFRLRAILDLLKKDNAKIGRITDELYKRCIDYGAHPNERSLSQILSLIEDEKTIEFKLEYFAEGKEVKALCLKTCAQVGTLCLKIFELIIPERFKLTQLDKKLGLTLIGL